MRLRHGKHGCFLTFAIVASGRNARRPTRFGEKVLFSGRIKMRGEKLKMPRRWPLQIVIERHRLLSTDGAKAAGFAGLGEVGFRFRPVPGGRWQHDKFDIASRCNLIYNQHLEPKLLNSSGQLKPPDLLITVDDEAGSHKSKRAIPPG